MESDEVSIHKEIKMGCKGGLSRSLIETHRQTAEEMRE